MYVSVTGLDEKGFIARSRLSLDGPPQGLMTILGGKPLTAANDALPLEVEAPANDHHVTASHYLDSHFHLAAIAK